MINAAITGMAFAVPEKILDNAEILRRFPQGNMESFLKVIGIEQRHILSEGESESDVAVKAAEELFAQTGVDRTEIDAIVYCTQSPDHLSPTTATIMQDRLGLNSNILAFDMSQTCTSFVHLMQVCNSLIASGARKKILAFTADATSQLIHPMDGTLVPIHGDGAIATLVEPSPDNALSFEWFDFAVDGSQKDRLIIPMGGSRMPFNADKIEETVDGFGNVHTSQYLHMDGAAVFHFVVHTIPKFIKQACQKNNVKLEDYDLIVFHQANNMMVDMLYKLLKVPTEKRMYYIKNIGNMSGGSLPAALHEAIRIGKCGPNSRVLLTGFGAGMSWASMSIRLGDVIVGNGVE